jgi:hypothetical protein
MKERRLAWIANLIFLAYCCFWIAASNNPIQRWGRTDGIELPYEYGLLHPSFTWTVYILSILGFIACQIGILYHLRRLKYYSEIEIQ